MPAQPNRRMPLSCEPCRERKIRCPRPSSTSPGGPCATCVRRGIPADECVFLREVYSRQASRPQTAGAVAVPDHSREATNSELLERIRKLETLVVGQVSNGALQPLAEALVAPLSPLIGSGGRHADTTVPSGAPRGSLVKSASGHERYEPLSSKWTSVLASSPMEDGVSVDALKADSGSEFPFTMGKLQLDEILSALPAMSHCDELKDVYMSVFAPVRDACRRSGIRGHWTDRC